MFRLKSGRRKSHRFDGNMMQYSRFQMADEILQTELLENRERRSHLHHFHGPNFWYTTRHERKNHHAGRASQRARESRNPIHRGRRHRPRHHPRGARRPRRRGREGLRRQPRHCLARGACRRQGARSDRRVAPQGDARRLPRLPRLHQGPLDHAGRRRHRACPRR